jgi:peptidoglycan-associated lipoprotein
MLSRLVLVLVFAGLVMGCETPSEDTGASSAGAGAGTGGVPSAGSLPPGTGGYGSGSGYGSGGFDQRALGAGGAAAQVAQQLVATGDTVYFDFDSYALDGEAQATLDKQASLLLKSANVPVAVEGHCDERGTREYNLALGERRATAVKDYLVAYGVAPSRIRVVSYGKERPAVIGSNEAAWAKNRRSVTVVSGAAAGS